MTLWITLAFGGVAGYALRAAVTYWRQYRAEQLAARRWRAFHMFRG